jgi:hypothetical protein
MDEAPRRIYVRANRFKFWTWVKLMYMYHTASRTIYLLGRTYRTRLYTEYPWETFLFIAKLELLEKERGKEWMDKTTIIDALRTKV